MNSRPLFDLSFSYVEYVKCKEHKTTSYAVVLI